MDYAREQELIKSFGENLRKIRKGKKISLRKFALKADLDYSNLQEIEIGKVNPSYTTIILLAEALQIDPAQLLPQ
jgi:transcriptional regulator with XRE-family HTH domain